MVTAFKPSIVILLVYSPENHGQFAGARVAIRDSSFDSRPLRVDGGELLRFLRPSGRLDGFVLFFRLQGEAVGEVLGPCARVTARAFVCKLFAWGRLL